MFGMGYVGCVSGACLAEDGHQVIGVDVSDVKLEALQRGEAPIKEPGLQEIIRDAVAQGRLRATKDVAAAVNDSDLSLVCVGTPSEDSGRIDLTFVERVCEQIGEALGRRAPGHTVAIRSTMLPGSMAALVRPTLEKASGCKEGEHFHTAFNPEFLRESTAIRDYRNPPVIVIGAQHPVASDLLRRVYAKLDVEIVVTSTAVAELVKYTANAWHALKISFANEIGAVCRQVGVDSHDVMDIFARDTQLNISKAYLKPGFAFGGSCLPKDLRALTYFARHHDIRLPVIDKINVSNQTLIESVCARILATGARRVGIYGLSFKPNTDDLRESPFVALAEWLIGKGVEVRIFDDNIQVNRLTGANKAYIDQRLPHLVQHLVGDMKDLESFAQVMVLGHRTQTVEEWVKHRPESIKILDLARIPGLAGEPDCEGVSW